MENVIVVDSRDKLNGYRPDKTVPFDRFYLVKKEAQHLLNRMVPYAIVVPLTTDYRACLQRMGLDVEKLIAQNYQVAVPINMQRVRTGKGMSRDQVQPTYVANTRWWRRADALGEFIPEDVTLVTPSGEITPMCVACKKSLDHLAGECKLGTKACLENLRIEQKTMNEQVFEKAEREERDISLNYVTTGAI